MKLSRTKKFADIIIENGIITKEQLNLLLEKQQSVPKPLSHMLIDAGYVNEEEVSKILTTYQKQMQIGDLLIQMGLISENDLKLALENKVRKDDRLGDILVREHLIDENEFLRVLSMQLGIPRMIPKKEILDTELILKSNEKYLRANFVIPAFKSEGILTCIMADPLDATVVDAMISTFGCEIEVAIASKSEIMSLIDQVFSSTKIEDGLGVMNITSDSGIDKVLVIDESKATKEENIIVSILNYIVTDAVKDGASDIHIEPRPTLLVIRNRIDGILYRKSDLPKHIAPLLLSRIKALCGLDVAQKRQPQDGRISSKIRGREIDMRVATYPAEFGENVTIRILDRQAVLVDMNKLGFNPVHKKKYEEVLNYPSGMILITGPTGSGKTTTLYSSINNLREKNKKIITVEDPVEYTLPGITQAQYSVASGVTYDTFLKAMMRQDPDVIMVGEIRDHAAAEVTVQAALTGHKVFSTFHTEDTTGALLRLMDMGIETFLISSTVICVIAQRLIRRNCPYCQVPYIPPPETLAYFKVREIDFERHKFSHGRGCPSCRNTGYHGRIGIFEVLTLNDTIRDAILMRKTSSEIRRLARNTVGILSMMEDGFYKSLKSITTLEEILRVIYNAESETWAGRTADEIIRACEGFEVNAPAAVESIPADVLERPDMVVAAPLAAASEVKKSEEKGTDKEKKPEKKPASLWFSDMDVDIRL